LIFERIFLDAGIAFRFKNRMVAEPVDAPSREEPSLRGNDDETSTPRKFTLEGDRLNIDMVMPRTTARDTVSAGGEETEEGRRATLVSSPLVASPELVDRPRRRRTFTAADKVRILAEIDRAGPGGSGAILRREGLYSSALTDCAANATSAPMRGHNKNCAQLYDV
jgi:hypothetical protein